MMKFQEDGSVFEDKNIIVRDFCVVVFYGVDVIIFN